MQTSRDLRLDKILMVILIFSILASVAILIYIIITPKQGEKFTEFYILGGSGKAEGYPVSLRVGEGASVIVGVVNHEYSLVNYTLQILLEKDILDARYIQLGDNSTWEERVFFVLNTTGENLKLQFLLYKENNLTSPYRDLHLWVNVK